GNFLRVGAFLLHSGKNPPFVVAKINNQSHQFFRPRYIFNCFDCANANINFIQIGKSNGWFYRRGIDALLSLSPVRLASVLLDEDYSTSPNRRQLSAFIVSSYALLKASISCQNQFFLPEAIYSPNGAIYDKETDCHCTHCPVKRFHQHRFRTVEKRR